MRDESERNAERARKRGGEGRSEPLLLLCLHELLAFDA